MSHHPDRDIITPRKQRSTPHQASEIEVSAGIVEPKHFSGPLAGPLLLFILILSQTRHRSVRWRRGEWCPIEELAADAGRPVRTIQRWLRQLEDAAPPGPYIAIDRSNHRGIRIQLLKRIWFRGRKAMVTTIGEYSPGGDTSVTTGDGPVVTKSVGGGDTCVTTRTKSVTTRPLATASGADSVIRLSRTSSYEPTSREPVEKSGVKSVADRRAFWSEKLAEAESAGDEPGAAWARRNLAGVERGGFDP